MKNVPFNRATTAPSQHVYLAEAAASGCLAGDGPFSKRAATLLREWTGAEAVLLTPSCTDALEMTALLAGIGPGDEVIVPSFTFVSTANAFALLGARPVFVDIDPLTMNIDPDAVGASITPRTKALVIVHYGGIPCDTGRLAALAEHEGLVLIEDAAHGLLGTDDGVPMGSRGAMATLSFHETKNFSCGEGGALLLNDPTLVERAEVIREKGTNRSQFFRGGVDKYTWIDIGSSYLLADFLSAVLLAQFEFAEVIQSRREAAWRAYEDQLGGWASALGVRLGFPPRDVEHPFHLFWMWMPDLPTRSAFIEHMHDRGVYAAFHYQPLNASPMGVQFGSRAGMCPVAEAAGDHLVRLPVFSDMQADEIDHVIEATLTFRPDQFG